MRCDATKKLSIAAISTRKSSNHNSLFIFRKARLPVAAAHCP